MRIVATSALENGERQGVTSPETLIDDLPLFSAQPAAPVAPPKSSDVEEAISETNPDELTPKQALALIYELKSMIISGSS